MQTRLSPDFKTHRVSTFSQEVTEQRVVVNSQRTAVDDLLPSFIKESPKFDRQIFKNISPEASEVLSINAPSLRNELKSTRELNRSNISIVNQFFRNDGIQPTSSSRRDNSSPSSPDKERESLKTILDRKDLEVSFFKQEMDKLRQQARIDRTNIEHLQETLKQVQQTKPVDSSILQRQKEMLQQRLIHLEREFEALQRELADKSRLTVSSASASSKTIEALQVEKEAMLREHATLMRKDIQQQNELEYFRTKTIALEKQLSDIQNGRDVSMEEYKREITYELNVLSSVNDNLVKENDVLKTTVGRLEAQHKEMEERLTQTRLQLADANLAEERKYVVAESELRTTKRLLEEKQFELTIIEAQLKNMANSRSVAEIDKENVIVQLQEQLRQVSVSSCQYAEENNRLTRENTDLHLKLNDARIKCQEAESKSRMLVSENQNLLETSRTLQVIDSKRKYQEEQMIRMSAELEEHRMMLRLKEDAVAELTRLLQHKQEEGKVAESDFSRIQSEIGMIKTHLRGQIDQLQRQKQILEDSNRDLRIQMQSEVNNTNALVQNLNNRLEDRERRLLVLEQELKGKSSEQQSRSLLSNELQQVRAQLRKEQHSREGLQTKLTEEQIQNQQLYRQKSELQQSIDRLRVDLKQQESRQFDGQHLNSVVQQLKRQIEELERRSKTALEQANSHHQHELNQKALELMVMQEQHHKLSAKHDEAYRSLREKEMELMQLKRTAAHIDEIESSLRLRETEMLKLKQQHSELEELRRIVEEQRQQVKQLELFNSEKLSTSSQRLAELEHNERTFQLKEQKINSIIRGNLSRLVQHQSYDQLNGGDFRQLVLNQFIEVAESMSGELQHLKQYVKDLEAEHRKKVEMLDRVQVELNSVSYEKVHLVNELDSMVSRLKYVEDYAEYLAGLTKSADAEGKRLKSLNKTLKGKLEKEVNERQWLQNKVKQAGETALVSPRIERAKQERVQIYNLMREVIDVNKQ